MKHIRAIHRKAKRVEDYVASEEGDVFALQQGPPPQQRPHYPRGCSPVFSPGWESDATGGTAGLCQQVERDLYDCYISCFWPAQAPDHLNNYPDWTSKCASATRKSRRVTIFNYPFCLLHFMSEERAPAGTAYGLSS